METLNPLPKAATVRSVLSSIAIPYSELSESLFRFSLEGLPSCIIRIRDQGIIFYSLYPNRIDKVHRKAVSEFLVRVNFSLNFGNFEFNLDDGQIRFKMSVQAAQTTDVSAPLKSCLILAQEVYPRWIPGIHLICQGVNSEEAYRTLKRN